MDWNLIVWWSLNNSKIPHQERNIFTVFWKLIMFLKGIRECSLDLTLCLFPITFTDIDKQFTKFLSTTDPVDTGHKLNVHRTFRKRPGRLLNVLYTFNLRPLSMGCCVTGFTYRVYCYTSLDSIQIKSSLNRLNMVNYKIIRPSLNRQSVFLVKQMFMV